ncbi:MAG: ATP-grasp domain-containing protein [Actinomycetota bacterium]
MIDERGYFWQPGRDGLVGVEIDIVMSRAEVCEIRRPFDPRIVKAYVNFLQACRNRDIATVNGHPFLLEVCQDKHLSHLVVEEVLREHGVHNPRTLFFASRKALERTLPALRFPLVLKDPYGTLGRGIHPVADAGELAGRLAGRHFPLLLQELVEKTCNDQGEYLATRVVVGREPLGERPIVLCFYTQCSRSFTTNLGDGGRVGRGAADPALLACSLAILERVQADLLAVDYLIDSRGRRVFLEINHAPGTSEQTLELKPDLWERVVELGIERWRRGFRLPLPASVTGPPQAGD